MLSIKESARRAIKLCAKRAPGGVRRALIQGIVERGADNGYGLTQFARAAGISTFMANGVSGLMQASAADETLLPIYAATAAWAPATVDFIRRAFPDGVGTYLDIGANIGLTTVPIAQNANVRCIAFEPDPTNFMHLSENVRRNCPHGNVELLQKAVMNKSGRVTFGLNADGNPGDHRVVNGSTDRQVLSVESVALDDIFSQVALPLAVKIDTQGAEPFVVAGGRSILALADAIVLEFWPRGMEQLGGSLDEIYRLIGQFRRITVTKAGGEDSQEFSHPDQAIATLSRYVREVENSPYPFWFWDIYMTR